MYTYCVIWVCWSHLDPILIRKDFIDTLKYKYSTKYKYEEMHLIKIHHLSKILELKKLNEVVILCFLFHVVHHSSHYVFTLSVLMKPSPCQWFQQSSNGNMSNIINVSVWLTSYQLRQLLRLCIPDLKWNYSLVGFHYSCKHIKLTWLYWISTCRFHLKTTMNYASRRPDTLRWHQPG